MFMSELHVLHHVLHLAILWQKCAMPREARLVARAWIAGNWLSLKKSSLQERFGYSTDVHKVGTNDRMLLR
jgi:hypothetical protein